VRLLHLLRPTFLTATLSLALALGFAWQASASRADTAGLLRAIDSDLGAMVEQSSMLHGQLSQSRADASPAASLVGIADGGYMSTVRSLHQTRLHLERRFGEPPPALSAMALAIGELAAAEDPGVRAAALDRLTTALEAFAKTTAAASALASVPLDETALADPEASMSSAVAAAQSADDHR